MPTVDMNYGEDIEPVSIEKLMEINQLALELDMSHAAVETLETQLSQAKGEVRRLSEDVLPEILLNLGHRKPIDLPCGKRIQVADVLKPSITERNKTAAFDWLDKNGHGGIIKREVKVLFDKEREQEAFELADKLRVDKYPVRLGGSVHAGTLKKFVRERLEEGVALPDSISVHRITIAKLL